MSATNLFEPVGEEARWKPVYEHLVTLEIGDVVTYDVLSDLMDVDARVYREPYYRAVRELERENKRTLVNVINVGYRVIDAPQHADVARLHEKRSRRQIRKARAKLQSADQSRLDAETRARFVAHELRLGQLEQQMGAKAEKKDLAALKARQEKTEAEIATELEKIQAVLDRHGLA